MSATPDFFFLIKANEIYRHKYSSENISNEVFHFFFVSFIELEFQARFSRVPLFYHFYPKIDTNIHFDSVFMNIGLFNRKSVNAVRFSIIKIRISISFVPLRPKLT